MSANTSLRVTELDFFSIKENLKNFLKSQSTFQDYDFDGSGLNILLDLLAYNTYYNAFYLNIAGNEAFLDTAQIRQNILSHAKLLGYLPGSKRGSESIIDIVATPSGTEDNAVTNITLDKFTRLLGYDIDGVNYPFVTINANTSTKLSGSFSFSNVIIRQGEVVTQQFAVDSNNPKRRFQLPSSNVDTTTLSVLVQESSSNTYVEEYFISTDITELTANTTSYFLEEDSDLKYTLSFGDGVIGKRPKDGNIVIVNYLDVSGDSANQIKNFTFIDPVGGLFSDNVSVTSSSSFGGSEKETIEQIRFRAPYYFTTQNRAVTVNDYITLLTKDYNNIDSVSVWGGEDNDPVIYGKVFISLKMKNYYSLTEAEKENIKADLIANRNVLTVIPEIIDPDYTFILIKGKVYFDSTKTSKTAAQLQTIITASIEDYNANELNNFESVFSMYKLQEYIENADIGITYSDLDVSLQKEVLITTGLTKTYELKFNVPIRKGTIAKSLSSFPQITVVDTTNQLRNVNLEEVPESLTGIASINITNPGINYDTAPTIEIIGDGTGATAIATVVGGSIRKIAVTNAGSNYTQATVLITGSGSEAAADVVLESTIGRLRTYYYRSNGEKVIVNENAGTIDYSSGKVTITSLSAIALIENSYYDSDVLTISVVPENDLILPLRNRILTIDTNLPKAIQIEVIST